MAQEVIMKSKCYRPGRPVGGALCKLLQEERRRAPLFVWRRLSEKKARHIGGFEKRSD